MDHKEIISEWFDLYGDDIFHFLLYRVGSSDAEDLVQEVFIRALKSYKHFENLSSPKTWLYSIARNVAIDEWRKRGSRKWKKLIPLDKSPEVVSYETPEFILDGNEETHRIFSAIRQLKPSYQEVTILRGVKELSIKETADILNWSESKVRSTQHRARQVLLEILRRDEDDELQGFSKIR
ncbi:RNA polymerase sigma factor [Bacillaceae bacterium S4-13-56]